MKRRTFLQLSALLSTTLLEPLSSINAFASKSNEKLIAQINSSSFKMHLVGIDRAARISDSHFEDYHLDKIDYTRIIHSEGDDRLMDKFYSYGIRHRKVSDHYLDEPYLDQSETHKILDVFKSRFVETDLVIFMADLSDGMSAEVLLAGMSAAQESGCKCLAILLEPPTWFKIENRTSYKKFIATLRHGMENVITLRGSSLDKKPEVENTVGHLFNYTRISRVLLLTLAQQGYTGTDWTNISSLFGPNKDTKSLVIRGRGYGESRIFEYINAKLKYIHQNDTVYIGITKGEYYPLETFDRIINEVQQFSNAHQLKTPIIKWLPKRKKPELTEVIMIVSS